jgi:hypothetical protein
MEGIAMASKIEIRMHVQELYTPHSRDDLNLVGQPRVVLGNESATASLQTNLTREQARAIKVGDIYKVTLSRE